MRTRLCPVCQHSINDDVPMVRAKVSTRVRRRWLNRVEAVCPDCLPPGIGLATSDDRKVSAFRIGSSSEVEPVPCDSCGLPVLLPPDPRRKVSTCSDRCRSRSYRHNTVTDSETRLCEGCGQPMAGRSDRRFCGSACRQRAYRQRVTD